MFGFRNKKKKRDSSLDSELSEDELRSDPKGVSTNPSGSNQDLQTVILLDIVKAKSLVKADLVGKSDPYVVVKYGQQEKKSKVINNTLDPEWNFETDISVPDGDNPFMSIEVFDSDTFGKDKSLGRVELDVFQVSAPKGKWFKLQGAKSGEIFLKADRLTQKKEKRSSMGNLLSKFDTSSKEKKKRDKSRGSPSPVRERRRSSSEDEKKVASNVSSKSGSSVSLTGATAAATTGSSPTLSGGLPAVVDARLGSPVRVRMNVMSARGLIKTDIFSKSDPYVLVKCGNQIIRTKTVKNSQEPYWDQSLDLLTSSSSAYVSVEVFDDDNGKDKSLGWVELTIPQLEAIRGPTWFQLQGVKSGGIQLNATVIGADSPASSGNKSQAASKKSSKSSLEGSPPPTISRKPKAPTPPPVVVPAFELAGQLTVILSGARNLIKSDLFGKSDPYALLTLGSQTVRTPTINNNQNPDWNFEHVFSLPDGAVKHIKVEVFDDDYGKDKSLGFVELSIAQLISSKETSFYLQGAKTGEILMTAHFSPMTEVPLEEEVKEGVLFVQVPMARNLPKTDLVGKADPYVVVTHGQKSARSKTVNNTKDPLWDFHHYFTVLRGDSRKIRLDVYDDDYGKDSLIGGLDFDLDKGNVDNQWISIQGAKSGELLVSAKFISGETLPENNFANRNGSMKSVSSSSSSSSEDETDDNPSLKVLNNRLVNYIDKVRLLQQSADIWKGMPEYDDRSGDIESLKKRFEEELEKWKNALTEAETEAARARVEADRLDSDHNFTKKQLEDKIHDLEMRDEKIAKLENELAEKISQNKLLIIEKDRIQDHEKELENELNIFRRELTEARNELKEEKVDNGKLKAKLDILRKEMETKIALLEKQLEGERRMSRLDFSNMDDKIRSEYAKRLRSELKKLRKQYKAQVELNKREFMTAHSTKMAELQQKLTNERFENGAAKLQLVETINRIQQFKDKVADLENANHTLSRKTQDLDHQLQDREDFFKSQMGAKDSEISTLQDEMIKHRIDYENMLEQKLAMDTEIAVYKGLIKSEEKRLSRASKAGPRSRSSSDDERRTNGVARPGSRHSLGSQGSKGSRSSSLSDKEKDEPGFFERMKDQIVEAID